MTVVVGRTWMNALLCAGAALAASGCHRDPPGTTRPGQIVPLDPAGLARVREREATARTAQPALRVVAWNLTIPQAALRATPADALAQFPAAVQKRLEALGAWSPRVSLTGEGASASFALSRATLSSVVRDQLTRPGRVELLAHDHCPKFTERVAVAGVEWITIPATGDEVPLVRPDAGGVASLATLRQAFTAFPLPAGLRWAHGAHRTDSGDIARIGYCVREQRINAPTFTEVRATLDPSTLAPMLAVTLDDRGANAFRFFAQDMNVGSDTGALNLLLGVDEEIVGPVRFQQDDAGPAKIEVVPYSRMGAVSPELVGALWRSGPITLPFQVEELAPPTTRTPGAPTGR